jgi:hypothetical protein
MSVSIKPKALSYALLFFTAFSAAGCGWPKKIHDIFFFEPNKWQDEIDIGARRLPEQNPGTPAAELARKKAMQKSGGPFAYPAQNSGAPMGSMPPPDNFDGKMPPPPMPPRPPMPQAGDYPAASDGFQPQGTKLPAWTKGINPDEPMPTPYGNPANNGLNPYQPSQHMIRRYETMANDVYMDGLKVVKPKNSISQKELPNIKPDKNSMFISDNYAPKVKKSDAKSMFPLEEYTPKSDTPVTSSKSAFPKLSDIPKNPEPFDKDKVNAEIHSLISELDKADSKRDAVLKEAESSVKTPAPLPRDNDAAALGVETKKITDTDKDILEKLSPTAKANAEKTAKESSNLTERRSVLGNIKAISEEKKTPKFINDDDVATNKFNDDLKAVLTTPDTPTANIQTTPEPPASAPAHNDISNNEPVAAVSSPVPMNTGKPDSTKVYEHATTEALSVDHAPPPIVTIALPPSPKVTVDSKKSTTVNKGLLPNSRYADRRRSGN